MGCRSVFSRLHPKHEYHSNHTKKEPTGDPPPPQYIIIRKIRAEEHWLSYFMLLSGCFRAS